MPSVLSRWTMFALRLSTGLFLALWGIDKLVSSDGRSASSAASTT